MYTPYMYWKMWAVYQSFTLTPTVVAFWHNINVQARVEFSLLLSIFTVAEGLRADIVLFDFYVSKECKA